MIIWISQLISTVPVSHSFHRMPPMHQCHLEKLISKLGMTRLSVSVFGRNLFYFYKALKNYDAESSVGTSWASQAVVGGSTTATRNFGVSLRASF